MEKRVKEAIRYLGYGRNTADEKTLSMISEAFAALEHAAGEKYICRIFDIEPSDNGKIKVAGMEIHSRSLERNLKGCEKVILFAATLGTGVDWLISRTSVSDMAKAVVLQACAAAFLEEYCDTIQQRIGSELKKEGLYLRPRFSPGYGDFDISFQKPIMRILECAKYIGLTITDSYMMTPSKSVTAVIGAGRTNERCPVEGCENCGKKDCEYRR